MPNALLYEINTRCWLRDLSQKAAKPVTLETVPQGEFQKWRALGFSHVWLMGVWETGPLARAQALKTSNFSDVLPDWREEDVVGSPYAIANYQVPAKLGGESGLNKFREQLHRVGMRLVLDFVPNHLGLDHAWVREKPELFVQSPVRTAETFEQPTPKGGVWLAHGRDPNFPSWADTVQLDYRLESTREAMTQLLGSLATRCDGVRCDMAMLLLNDVFARTWQKFPLTKPVPAVEFWRSAISAVKATHPDFMVLAEAYWGTESKLRELGFDFCYDKEWYDCLLSRQAGAVQRQLGSRPPGFIESTARFLENHDEPRIASLLSPAEHKAAALLLLGLPGMRIVHEGQLEGAEVRTPVTFERRPAMPHHPEVESIYEELFKALSHTPVGKSQGRLCPSRSAWPGNPTFENCLILQWQAEQPDFYVVVVNLAPHQSQCYVPLSVSDLGTYNWSMKNLLGPEDYRRAGEDLQNQGLYLDLPAHGAQLFWFQPVA